jgi:hypothetical protein
MGLTIRHAVRGDIGWILPRLNNLSDRYGHGSKPLFFRCYAENALQDLFGKHCCLVAENGDGGGVGVVGGFVADHPMNPNISVLSELFWHVDEKDRRAAILLLDSFVSWGKSKGVDWISFTLMASSPAGRKALERRGFRLAETTFILEK